MNIFNRRELSLTWDFNERNRIEGRLAVDNIKYQTKHRRVGGSHGGNLGWGGGPYNMTVSCEYHIYVHKDDYERAKHVIS